VQFVAVAVAVKATWSGAVPLEGVAVAEQVRVQGGVTLIVPPLVHVSPLDVAVSVQEYVPAAAYSWTEFFWADVWPSPKSHMYETVVELHPGVVAEAEKVTRRGAGPVVGETEALQEKAQLEPMPMVPVLVQVWSATVTERVQVKVPADA
jgi:hypothetical protein